MTTRYNGQNPESSPQSTGSKLRARLAEIEARMEGLESQIALLCVEKEEILGDLESVTYPVLTLEIVSEIFLHYVGSSPLRRMQDPLRLASVCREWRCIATSTHTLWTQFSYHRDFPDIDKLSNLLRTRPRHVRRNTFDPRAIFVTMEACITAFADAPQLRAAYLNRILKAQILLPWIQLTNLELFGYSYSEGIEILQQTPNLAGLRYSVSDWGPGVTSPPLLPHLRSLDLLVEFESKLLDHLNTPSLERLKLGRLSAAAVRRVESFIARSGCIVTALDLWGPRYMETLECISILPSLKEFTMRFPAWSTDEYRNLFDWMAEGSDDLPVLESLHLDGCKTDIPVGPLARMLSERWDGVDGATRITSFRLSFNHDHDNNSKYVVPRAQSQLLYLREQGLKMDIHHLPEWSTESISSPMVRLSFTLRSLSERLNPQMEELLAEETT
ncbi:hypothetical protein C8J57DRAFT_1736221 [Mycena rebaudengoi]|nr:hypothetical protein C8J57DRAFT_1736221 [Mycena rebaudengoi]